MAIFHLSVKNICRADGRSAVAAAAYRAGARLRNMAARRINDYSNRGGVVHSEILLPENAPAWMTDREMLWNAVDAAESRKDARVAKEVEIALPIELARAANIGLARQFAADLFTRRGVVADLSVHDAGDGNPHAHVLLATRSLAPDGFAAKNRQLDDRTFLSGLRETWEVYANRALEAYGAAARIDHRTLEAQGIDREPELHRGPNQRDDEPIAKPVREKPRDPKYRPAGEAEETEDHADPVSAGEEEGEGSGLVEQLHHVETQLANYLATTAEEREKARKRDLALQELNAYHLRIQRQQAYIETLRKHEAQLKDRHLRSIASLSKVFSATYRKPETAYASIWKLLTNCGPDLFASLFRKKKPSLFGALHGSSFLFLSSPKRKKAIRNAYALPDTMIDWLKAERQAEEMTARVHESGAELSQSVARAQSLHQFIQSQPPAQFDPDKDRDMRIQLFQQRNAVLARIRPSEIASSDLPDDRKAALLNLVERHREQREMQRGGR
ncbi:MAG: hypothetical protein QOF14_3711 [Hyphomicrobiales bacterium]|jgi:hypothetical protein|nr:hypothetical protein [Hyphomicrobiales bacterium]